jgi:hypothetical protein
MEANELLRIQHEVTSERNPEKRRAAIERAYVEDLRFLDSKADVVGRQAFSDRLQSDGRKHIRLDRLRPIPYGGPGGRRRRCAWASAAIRRPSPPEQLVEQALEAIRRFDNPPPPVRSEH